MDLREGQPSAPWYRYFWPWVLVALVMSSVVAGLASVYIAFSNADSLVRDDWYKDGKAINQRLEKEHNAVRLNLLAKIRVDDVTGEVSVDLSGDSVADLARLELELSHPTLSRLDQTIVLVRRELSGLYRGELSATARGRWYAILRPARAKDEAAAEAGWQLTQSIQLPSSDAIVLGEGS
jgi:hypothetical protein